MELFKIKKEFNILTVIFMIAMICFSCNNEGYLKIGHLGDVSELRDAGISSIFEDDNVFGVDNVFFCKTKKNDEFSFDLLKFKKIFIDGHEVSRIEVGHLSTYNVYWKGGYNPENNALHGGTNSYKYTLKNGILTIDAVLTEPIYAVEFIEEYAVKLKMSADDVYFIKIQDIVKDDDGTIRIEFSYANVNYGNTTVDNIYRIFDEFNEKQILPFEIVILKGNKIIDPILFNYAKGQAGFGGFLFAYDTSEVPDQIIIFKDDQKFVFDGKTKAVIHD